MPIYDWNTSAELPPAVITDAKGFRHRHVCWVDTDSGDMEKAVLTPAGDVTPDLSKPGEPLYQRVRVPAPVTVRFQQKEKPGRLTL